MCAETVEGPFIAPRDAKRWGLTQPASLTPAKERMENKLGRAVLCVLHRAERFVVRNV